MVGCNLIIFEENVNAPIRLFALINNFKMKLFNIYMYIVPAVDYEEIVKLLQTYKLL